MDPNEDPEVLVGKLIRKEQQRILVDLEKDASNSGRAPDKRALEVKLEKERREILNSESDFKDLLLSVLEAVAVELRARHWG